MIFSHARTHTHARSHTHAHKQTNTQTHTGALALVNGLPVYYHVNTGNMNAVKIQLIYVAYKQIALAFMTCELLAMLEIVMIFRCLYTHNSQSHGN